MPKVNTRRTTVVQDRKVLKLLREGHARKTVSSMLSLTYWQVMLAVQRHETKSGRKSNL